MIRDGEPGAQTLCACAGSVSATAPSASKHSLSGGAESVIRGLLVESLFATSARPAASIFEVVGIPDLDPDDVGDGAAAGLVAGNDHARETVRAQKLPVLLIG